MKNVGDPAVANTDDCPTCAEATASSRIHLPPNIAIALKRIELLTQREREVFQLLSEGLSNNELAVKLSITTRTAKAHVASIIDKLQLDSRLQVCLLACVYFADVCPEDK
jgi:DNA-binding NarL/FixJ family response regulator